MQFDPRKAIAAIGFLVQHSGAELYPVMKMLYLADKCHLSKYGRTIVGDDYVAMEKGPVPKHSYDLCKYLRGERRYYDRMPDAKKFIELGQDHQFHLLNEPELDQLSRSDIRCLEEILNKYDSGKDRRKIFDDSHDQAWADAWAAATARGQGSVDISILTIAAALPNAVNVIQHLQDPHPGEAEYEPIIQMTA